MMNRINYFLRKRKLVYLRIFNNDHETLKLFSRLKVTSRFFSLLVLTFLIGCSSYSPRYRIDYGRYPKKKYWHSSTERPYVIKGVRYYPQVHYGYSRIGYASWYGYDCHGKPTAMGHRFHKNGLTAAHRTLPLPSIVLVENLSNGRKVKLLVNDRGPFARTESRIIDVTQRAAHILGFRIKGKTKVRVTCLPMESWRAAKRFKKKPYPIGPGKIHLESSLQNKEEIGRLKKYKRKRSSVGSRLAKLEYQP